MKATLLLRHVRAVATVATSLALGACAHQPQMYSWDSYQPAVYSYLQADGDPSEQIQSMEKNIETARAANKPLPPGFHAQLGMLYLQSGKSSDAVEQLQKEKTEFPEATTYMDFLLKRKGADTDQGHDPQSSLTREPAHTLAPIGKPQANTKESS
ncbi:MAG TPA: DUF4810 domain-containing protein [Castellaniella sp.]|uniref:DUF4810 domain-containing protein n=1 Tax=Castellaniella sp. TaxID=1955812 RepID=UPI002F24D02F